MIGKSLGPYRILEPLGAGGMGEVYLAEDTRLGRKVAVKVLPAEFASDPERLARFEQEARAAAALNHPHIAAVFDVGSAMTEVLGGDGGDSDAGDSGPVKAEAVTHYMVQEYLEGQTLGDALRPGRLPIKRALDLMTEVTEALAAAHGAGIIHRDLKPANIFITKDNHAKVLDFGLAKLTELAAISAPDGASKSPTLLGTVAGQVMGTAGYMAPEQIEASGEIDRRADVFAFGCVLYESVTGSQAFAGTSVLDTLHKIAHSQPRELREVDEGLPAEIQRIIGKCLAKEPSARYQHADDLIVDLKGLATQVETGTAPTIAQTTGALPIGAVEGATAETTAATAVSGLSWKIAAPALVVVAALAGAAGWMLRPAPAEPPPRSFAILYPDELQPGQGASLGVAISPDGERIVFEAGRDLWMRSIDDLVPAVIRDTTGARNPFFSPDGEQLGFRGADGQMKRVAVTGGAPVSIGAASGRPFGASWGDDGFIYYGLEPGNVIVRVPETGGVEPEVVVQAADGEQISGPEKLPGSEWLLYSAAQGSNWADAAIVATRPGTGERKVVLQGGSNPRYAPTGHLIYFLDGNLLAVGFDAEEVAIRGGPVSVVEGVTAAGLGGLGQFGFSPRGDLVYLPGSGGGAGRFNLVIADRQGNVEILPFEPAGFDDLDLAPDDNRIAVAVDGEGGSDIWIYEIDGGRSIRLTTDGASEKPSWSPDGEWVYYTSSAESPPGVWRRRADRSAPPERVSEAGDQPEVTAVSPDGAMLLVSAGAGAARDLALFPSSGDAAPTPLPATDATDWGGDFSPDGRFVTFFSNESGEYRVYAQEIATNVQRPVSPALGVIPIWSPDGREIFYGAGGRVDVAEVETEPQFRVVATRTLFPYVARSFTNFDVTSDGQHFLFVQPAQLAGQGSTEGTGRRELHVKLGWFANLLERVPAGR